MQGSRPSLMTDCSMYLWFCRDQHLGFWRSSAWASEWSSSPQRSTIQWIPCCISIEIKRTINSFISGTICLASYCNYKIYLGSHVHVVESFLFFSFYFDSMNKGSRSRLFPNSAPTALQTVIFLHEINVSELVVLRKYLGMLYICIWQVKHFSYMYFKGTMENNSVNATLHQMGGSRSSETCWPTISNKNLSTGNIFTIQLETSPRKCVEWIPMNCHKPLRPLTTFFQRTL